jgi:hypothetical protein
MLGVSCDICKQLDPKKFPKKSRNLHHKYLFELEDHISELESKHNELRDIITKLDNENGDIRKMLFGMLADYRASKDPTTSESYMSAYSYFFNKKSTKEANPDLKQLEHIARTQ